MSKRLQAAAVTTVMFATAITVSALASVASAKGIGVGMPSLEGVVTPDGEVGYSAYPTEDETVVIRIERGDALPALSNTIGRSLVVPAVAADGTGAGVSGDGSTLVLASSYLSAGPGAKETSLTLLDGANLTVQGKIRLPGSFSVDAVSPDGSTIYLIEYTSTKDPTEYAVRAYDTDAGRLIPGQIVDLSEPDEDMSGVALTRANSPDGRWAYTLYHSDTHPFIHALDTEAGSALCIDLPHDLRWRELYQSKLLVSDEGRTITVEGKDGPLAVVDTESFEVREPVAAASDADEGAPTETSGGGASWALIALACALLIGLTAAAVRTLRKQF